MCWDMPVIAPCPNAYTYTIPSAEWWHGREEDRVTRGPVAMSGYHSMFRDSLRMARNPTPPLSWFHSHHGLSVILVSVDPAWVLAQPPAVYLSFMLMKRYSVELWNASIFGIKVQVPWWVVLDDRILLLQYDVERFVYRMMSCQKDVGLDASCAIRRVIRVFWGNPYKDTCDTISCVSYLSFGALLRGTTIPHAISGIWTHNTCRRL